MDPLTTTVEAVVIGAATRYLLHAWEQIGAAWNAAQKGNRRIAVKKAANVLLASALPCWGTITWGYSAIPNGGTLGALFTGLALAAGIAGLHNLGKTGREGKALENALTATRLGELLVQLRSIGAHDVAEAVAAGRVPTAEDLRASRPAPVSGRYPGPYAPGTPGHHGPPQEEGTPLMGED